MLSVDKKTIFYVKKGAFNLKILRPYRILDDQNEWVSK